MNRKNNTIILLEKENSCNPSFSMVYKNSCSQDGFMEFNIFLYSNSFQEKLPIVYANIRV